MVKSIESVVHWDAPAVSSYVHIETQMAAHFPTRIWNAKTPSTLRPPILRQDKICFLPSVLCVCLSFPQLYLPRIIVNHLHCEIYSVRWRDSWKHTDTLGGFRGDTGSAPAVVLTMINGKETGWDAFVFVCVAINWPPEQNDDNAFNGSISIIFMGKTCGGMCAERTHTVTVSFNCSHSHAPSSFHNLTLNRPWFLSSPLLFPFLFLFVHFLFHSAVWCQGHLNESLSLCASYFPKATWKERCHTVASGRKCTAKNVNLSFHF